MYYQIKKINHKFLGTLKGKRALNLIMSGKIKGNLLHVSYDNTNEKIHQFGNILLNVNSNNKMEGPFLGLGPKSNKIITGKVVFKKM